MEELNTAYAELAETGFAQIKAAAKEYADHPESEIINWFMEEQQGKEKSSGPADSNA